MRAIIYQVDDVNYSFNSLKEAKWHVQIAYTNKERLKYRHESWCIYGISRKGDLVSSTEIKIDDDGNLSFGRTLKLY